MVQVQGGKGEEREGKQGRGVDGREREGNERAPVCFVFVYL